jgi:parallel beta-helix repeat protein
MVLAAPQADAELATEAEATMVAGNWATYVAQATGGWGGAERPVIAGRTQIVVGDTLLGWVFDLEPSGHVVVPAIKELPPVKSYSDRCGMRVGDPDGYGRLIEEVLADRIRTLVAAYGSMEATAPMRGGEPLGAEHRAEWDRFTLPPERFEEQLGGRLEPLTEVGPLLTTAWHQAAPYNKLCPMGDGGKTFVGCVATATAQILRYHGSPSEGFGSHSYYWNGDNSCGGSTPGTTLTARYDDAYDWENMPTSCGGGCSTAEQDALAELCYEVGVAFDMNYGHCGSGTFTHLALEVFPIYFGYSSSIRIANRYNHSVESWFAIIQDEINQDRPMQYCIPGHSIVCDGWRDTGGTKQYHMNYGWADSHNAWYVLDNLYGSDDPDEEYLIRRIIPPDSPWEDVTGGLPIADTGNAVGVSWCDLDGDGDIDLYFSNDGTGNVLARNEGFAGFVDGTSGPLGDPGNGAATVWGDYDNDGDPDLYVVNTGGANVLMRNDGGGTFTDVTSGPLGDTGDGYGAAWSDYDLDGDIDLYFANSGSANKLLRNDGGGVFTDVTMGPLGDSGAGRGVAWSDYDVDGDPDLYVANYGTSNKLLRNDGGGVFTDVTSGPLADTGNSTGVAWGDYDNDGEPDLYVANYGSANRLLKNDAGAFADVGTGVAADAGNGTGVAWGDYDLDGDLDLYLVNDGSANRLLRNLGDDVFIDVATSPIDDGGDGQGAAWGDFDRDGRLDLAVMNRNGANVLLRGRTSNTASFLRVTLAGAESNRSGIGARVRLVTSDGQQFREVSGGSGYLSQNSLSEVFGVGLVSHVDTLEIRWPSGIVNTYEYVGAGQSMTYTEIPPPAAPTGLVADPIEAGLSLSWEEIAGAFTHYRIERDTTPSFGVATVEFVTTDTSYVDFPLVEVRDYYYRVFAVGIGGNESDPSGTVSGVPLQTPPDVPTALVATAGDAQVRLDWEAVSAPDLDHYLVQRDLSPDFDEGTVEFTRALPFLTDGPLSDNEYYYRVFAVDWGGLSSAPSETVSCTPSVLPPSPPEGLITDSGDGFVSLDWDANQELDIARYIVYRDTLQSGPGDSLGSPVPNVFTDSTAANYTVYWYWVRAVDIGGLRSEPSTAVAGVAAPGGAVFVDCEHAGYENGSSTYPYNELTDAIGAAADGGVILVFPGECAGNLVLDEAVVMLGMSGADSTSIVSMTGSVVSAVAGSDGAKLQGLTIDAMGAAPSALSISCSGLEIIDCVIRGAGGAGALVQGGAEPKLAGNVFADNYYGISCADSSRPRLSRNVFMGSILADIANTGDPGPLVGGSLAAANDFLEGGFFAVFNTGPTAVDAQFNYWRGTCPDSLWFYGQVSYSPWTDTLHITAYYECPGTGMDDAVPTRYALGRNLPNPFNPSTRISYDVPPPGSRVELSIYNAAGALVRRVVNGVAEPGRHTALWDGTDELGRRVSSGVYFYRLTARDFTEQRKMVLLK